MNAPRSNRPNDNRNYSAEVFVEEKDDFDFREQLDVFWRRKWTIIIVSMVVLALGAVYTLTRKAVFEATATIALATTSSHSGLDTADNALLSTIMAQDQSRTVDTQVEFMKSPDLLDVAFDTFPKQTQMRGWGTNEIPTWCYSIEYKPNSDVVDIVGKAYTARLAADLANHIVQTYTIHDQKANRSSITKTIGYVESERKQRTAEHEKAMDNLARYQREHNLVAIDQQAQNAANSYTALENENRTAVADLSTAQKQLGLLDSLRRKTDPTIPTSNVVQENPEYASAYSRLTQLEADRAVALEEYIPTAIEVTSIDNQIREQNDKLRAITKRVVSSETTSANPAIEKLDENLVDALSRQAASRERVRSSTQGLAKLSNVLTKFPAQQRDLALLTQKVAALEATLTLLNTQFYNLQIAEKSTASYVLPISNARPPKYKSYPRVTANLVGFLFLGVLMGIGLAMLRERLDTRVHDPFIVDRITGLTSLSAIPETEPVEDALVPGRLLIGQVENNHAFVESFRLLRNNIMFSSPDKEIKLLGVTSPSKSEGKSTVAVNLAIALAMDGKRVLIIDCDLRRPTIHTWMNVGREIGLTSVVKNITTLSEAIKPTPFPSLDCLTSGPLPPNPTEFLNSDQTRMLFEQAANMYDVVVLDSPPCTGLSDVQVISTVSDGMVLVVSLNSTTKQSLVATTRMLRQANAPMLGTAINRIQYQKSSYGYYAYSYYYYYSQYEEDDDAPKKKKKRRKKKPTEAAGKK